MIDVSRRQALSFFGSTALFAAWPQLVAAKTSTPILILVELQGANDGLNTYVPYQDPGYFKLRPKIALRKEHILTVTETMGFHFSLENLARHFERGECQIVQNLGYPNPILSHFRSIELWERGGDGKRNTGDGWLVKTLDQLAMSNNWDAKAITLDNEAGLFTGGMDGYLGPNSIGYVPTATESRDSTIPVMEDNKAIGLLGELIEGRKTSHDQIMTIKRKLDENRLHFGFGRGDLGKQLSQVCTLIGAGMELPVYKVSIGSFDTHINQYWNHRDLLRELDESLDNTVKALKKIGVWDNTIIMTYSEFGRRASENGSRGTDHGMAAPHLMLGGRLKGGFIGHDPKLKALDNNNLTFSIDYRALYDHVLSTHFGVTDNPFSKYRDPIFSADA